MSKPVITATKDLSVEYIVFDGAHTKVTCTKSSYDQIGYRDSKGGYGTSPNDLVDIVNSGLTIELTIFPLSLGEQPLISAVADPDQVPHVYTPELGNRLFTFGLNHGQLSFKIVAPQWNAGVPANPTLHEILCDELIPMGVWTRVALVWNESFKMYVNGREVQSSITNVWIPTNYRFVIGNYGEDFYQGYMRDVCIWKGKRDPKDLGLGNRARLAPDAVEVLEKAGLGGYWPMDEGSDTKVHDLTSVGNEATLEQGEWQSMTAHRAVQPAHFGQPWKPYHDYLAPRLGTAAPSNEELHGFRMQNARELSRQYFIYRVQACTRYKHLFKPDRAAQNPFDALGYVYTPAPPGIFPGELGPIAPQSTGGSPVAGHEEKAMAVINPTEDPKSLRGNPDYLDRATYGRLSELMLGKQLAKTPPPKGYHWAFSIFPEAIESSLHSVYNKKETIKTLGSLYGDAYLSLNPRFLLYQEDGGNWGTQYTDYLVGQNVLDPLLDKIVAAEPDFTEVTEAMSKIAMLGDGTTQKDNMNRLFGHTFARLVFERPLDIQKNDDTTQLLKEILEAMQSEANEDEESRNETKEAIDSAGNSLLLASMILEVITSDTVQNISDGYARMDAISTGILERLGQRVTPTRLGLFRGVVGTLAMVGLMFEDPRELDAARKGFWALTCIHTTLSIAEAAWDTSAWIRNIGEAIGEYIAPTRCYQFMKAKFGNATSTIFGDTLGEFLASRLGVVLLVYGAALSFVDFEKDKDRDEVDAVFDIVLGVTQLGVVVTIIGNQEAVLRLLGVESAEGLAAWGSRLGTAGMVIGGLVILASIAKWVYDNWFSDNADKERDLEKLVGDLEEHGYAEEGNVYYI